MSIQCLVRPMNVCVGALLTFRQHDETSRFAAAHLKFHTFDEQFLFSCIIIVSHVAL